MGSNVVLDPILQNIFFCVLLKKDSLSGLERCEGECLNFGHKCINYCNKRLLENAGTER